jgi:penicillin amidase
MSDTMVRRDAWGVPQLWAPDVISLSRLQGRACANDRAWQLEVQRRRSEGRVAEDLGPAWVEWDVFARRARITDTAQRCFERLDDETAEWVAAYADGVNDGLGEAVARRAAPEFGGLEPGSWDPWTPIGVLLTQHVLFGTLGDKLWRDRVRRQAPDAWDLLCGPRHPPAAEWDGVAASGSNAWAVAASRSATSHPFVAGDPHRSLELPGVYQQVRLACPEFDVVGIAFAGVPGTPHFAHAGDVAWGITNAMSDCHDVFEEELRRSPNGIESREADGWAPAQSQREVVVVRGSDPVEVEVVETARGPVVVGDADSARCLSVRMVPRVERDAGLAASLALLRSRSAQDVRDAWRGWVEPVNAVLTADRAGTVLEFTAGLVPDRAAANREGPVPGWDPQHSWTGYLDHAESAVADVAVHANHATRHTAPLGRDFASPDRAHRIAELLAGTTALDADALQSIHTDTFHAPARRILPRLSALSGLSEAAAALREDLFAWDCRMDADSALAHRYAVLRAALVASLCRVHAFAGLTAGSDVSGLFDPWMSLALRVSVRLESFLAQPPDGFDVPAELAAALETAAAAPDARWGDRHRLVPIRIGPPGEAPPEWVGASGDRDCVFATSSLPDSDDLFVQAPAARYVWDLADRSASRWVVPHGTAGSAGSAHADDQQSLWLHGELAPVPNDDLAEGPCLDWRA